MSFYAMATIEVHTATRARALRRLMVGYAMKFVNDAEPGEYPSDEAIARVCAPCVRSPRPEQYEAIRLVVLGYEAATGSTTRRADQ
jgi:hypothetical protein